MPEYLAIFWFLRHVNRKLDSKQSSWDSKQRSSVGHQCGKWWLNLLWHYTVLKEWPSFSYDYSWWNLKRNEKGIKQKGTRTLLKIWKIFIPFILQKMRKMCSKENSRGFADRLVGEIGVGVNHECDQAAIPTGHSSVWTEGSRDWLEWRRLSYFLNSIGQVNKDTLLKTCSVLQKTKSGLETDRLSGLLPWFPQTGCPLKPCTWSWVCPDPTSPPPARNWFHRFHRLRFCPSLTHF